MKRISVSIFAFGVPGATGLIASEPVVTAGVEGEKSPIYRVKFPLDTGGGSGCPVTGSGQSRLVIGHSRQCHIDGGLSGGEASVSGRRNVGQGGFENAYHQ